MVLLNRDDHARQLSVTWAELGVPSAAPLSVYDVIRRQPVRAKAVGVYSALIDSHDVAFIRLKNDG